MEVSVIVCPTITGLYHNSGNFLTARHWSCVAIFRLVLLYSAYIYRTLYTDKDAGKITSKFMCGRIRRSLSVLKFVLHMRRKNVTDVVCATYKVEWVSFLNCIFLKPLH